MLILSQNERKIINCSNIAMIDIGSRNNICANYYDECEEIGYYETEERAKEILKDILVRFNNNDIIFEMPKE